MATLSASIRMQQQSSQNSISHHRQISSSFHHNAHHQTNISNNNSFGLQLRNNMNAKNPSHSSISQSQLIQSSTTITNSTMTTTTNTSMMSNDTMSSFIMNRLYGKSQQQKSWQELTKSMKQCLMEKRPIATDQHERFQLQKCLDTIQNNIEVKSISTMMERLETICRQLKLKFTSSKLSECFVYSDMYYVEIKFDQEKEKVVDCKIAHHTHEASTCRELIDVLGRGDFQEFTKHLEGLTAIYKINSDKPAKEKAYLALHALEKDLEHLAELQKNQINDINNLVHRSPVGVLEPRKGGHPMKLTFFVPPYDLLDFKEKISLPLTVDVVMERKLGYSSTICLEDSEQTHRLQLQSLITVKQQTDGKNLPQFLQHSHANSQLLPACYVLRLTRFLPISLDLLHKIQKLTGITQKLDIETKNSSSLISLLTKVLLPSNYFEKDMKLKTTTSSGPSFSTPSFLTILPDQNHCYYVNDDYANGNLLNNKDSNYSSTLRAVLLEQIPFTHPTHVPRILVYLRQQVLFNVILGSIIRQLTTHSITATKKKDSTNAHIFEISYFGLTSIYVQFEHPLEQSLATMEIDLKDITQVKCKLYANATNIGSNSSIQNKSISLNAICNDDYVTKIMQKSLSIPITMRSIMNRCREAQSKLKEADIMNGNERPPQALSIQSTNQTTTSTPTTTSSILYQAMQQSNNNNNTENTSTNQQQQQKSNLSLSSSSTTNIKSEFYPNSNSNTNNISSNNEQPQMAQKNMQYLLYQQQQQMNNNSKTSNLFQKQQTMFQNKIQQNTGAKQGSASLSNTQNTMLMSMLSDVPSLGVSSREQHRETSLQSSTRMSNSQNNSSSNSKKRKRLSGTSDNSDYNNLIMDGGTVVTKQPRRTTTTIMLDGHHGQIIKQETLDSSDYPTTLSTTTSSQSPMDDLINDNKFHSIKSGDDGLNEQLKIIKSLEAISGQKESTITGSGPGQQQQMDNVPKLILKNEKFQSNQIKIGGSSNTSTKPTMKTSFISQDQHLENMLATTTQQMVKKERKRKRADSLEQNKEFIISSGSSSSDSLLSSSGQISSSTGTSGTIATNTTKPSQLSRMLSMYSNSGNVGGSSIQASNKSSLKKSSPPSISSSNNFTNRQQSIQSIGGGNSNLAMKISDKVLSILNKQPASSNNNGSNSNSSSAMILQQTKQQQQSSSNSSSPNLSSMLSSSSKTTMMSDHALEHAAAMAVAANSGGSAAMAHAAAMAAVQNSLSEQQQANNPSKSRFVKPSLKNLKTTGSGGVSSTSNHSAIVLQSGSSSSGSGSKSSPITITVSPGGSSGSSTGSQSLIATNSTIRKSEINKQVSGSGNSVLASSSVSSSSTTTSSSSKQQTTKIISPITSPKILQQSSSLLSSPSVLVQSFGGSSSSAANKTVFGKSTKKASLTSVVDRLLQKNAVDGSVSSGTTSAAVNQSSGILLSTQQSTSPEIITTSSSASTSSNSTRADSSSSSSKSSIRSQSNSESSKSKSFYRDSQFTIKQSNSGLKMSITKTKTSGGNNSNSSTGGNSQSSMLTGGSNAVSSAELVLSKISASVFKGNKYTIPKIQKTSTTSPSSAVSSSSSSTTTVSSSSSSNVVSTSAITSTTLSSSTSGVIGSTSPQSSNRRNANSSSPMMMNSGKISPASSNSNHHNNRMSPKSSNTSGGQGQKSLFKSPELPPPLLQQSPTTTGPSILPPPPPPPYSISAATSKSSVQMIQTTSVSNNNRQSSGFKSSGNYSPQVVAASGINWSSVSSSSQDKVSGTIMVQVGSSSDHLGTGLTSSSGGNLDQQRSGVSSSSEQQKTTCLSTSTPSSPAESSSPLSAENQNPPLIIPTEAISDHSENGKSLTTSISTTNQDSILDSSTTTSLADSNFVSAEGLCSATAPLSSSSNLYDLTTNISSSGGNSKALNEPLTILNKYSSGLGGGANKELPDSLSLSASSTTPVSGGLMLVDNSNNNATTSAGTIIGLSNQDSTMTTSS